MFKLHIQYEQYENAECIGDEYLEWIKDLDNEEIFYYHQEELEEMYRDLKRKRRKRRR